MKLEKFFKSLEMGMNSQIKDNDQFIVDQKKLFCLNVNSKFLLIIRDLLKIFKFRKIKVLFLVNTFNQMIYNGFPGIGSKLKLV